MESQPQNPEFRNNPENFHLCDFLMFAAAAIFPDYLFKRNPA